MPKIKEKISQIFKCDQIQKINIGFSNDVFDLDNRYILKIFRQNNPTDIQKEVYFSTLFQGCFPIAKTIAYNLENTPLGKPYILFEKIHGQNLYAVWHQYTLQERESIVQQLCDILGTINQTSSEQYQQAFSTPKHFNWKIFIIDDIKNSLDIINKQSCASPETIAPIISSYILQKITDYVELNSYVLDKTRMALCHWDPHFDNILVKDKKIVGLLDFERTDYASIDYVLDLVRRMQDFPQKYVCKHYQSLIKNSDYTNLLNLYQKFYPNLFDFEHLDVRLNLYTIKHDLNDIVHFPECAEKMTDIILKYIGTPA